MTIRWSDDALRDVERLHRFLAPVAPGAADKMLALFGKSVSRLNRFPRLGLPLGHFGGLEIRRLFVRDYEIRYEIRDDAVYILNVWHIREDRP